MPKVTKTEPVIDSSGPAPDWVAERIKVFFPDLAANQLAMLKAFYTEFQATHRTMSLVSGSSLMAAESVLFFDSIRASQLIHPELVVGHPVFDIGGASGFPGIVFAILYPKISVHLVESDSRKVDFFKRVIAKCSLGNLSVQATDFERLSTGVIRNGILRSLPSLTKTLLAGRKHTAKGGKLFHMKGDSWTAELASVPPQLFSFWSAKLLGTYKLPTDGTNMNLLLTEKIAD